MIYLGVFDFNKKRTVSDAQALFNGKWPNYIVTLNEKNFDDFIQKYPLSLVDFWASWCNPCKEMTPRLRRLSKVYKNKIAFGKLDTQKNQNVTKKYKVMGIPHLIFFSYGKKISSITGSKSVSDIKDIIDDILQTK